MFLQMTELLWAGSPNVPRQFTTNIFQCQLSKNVFRFEKSKITCKGKPKTISVGWSKSLDERVPGLTDLLRNIEFDAETMSLWSYEIGTKKRGPREVVQEWILNNSSTVDSWFGL